MTNLSTPSVLHKFVLKSGLALITALAIFWFTVDLWAVRKLPYIESSITAALHHPVSIEKAHYSLFGGFLLDGLEIKKNLKSSLPIRINRIRAVPAFLIYPKPTVRITKIIIEQPHIVLQAKPEEFFKACTKLRNMPTYRNEIGLLDVEVKLSSFGIQKGKVSLLPAEPGSDQQQNFEEVNFYVGRWWFQKNHINLSGHVAGRPNASFRIQCDIHNPSQRDLDTNIRADFHEFTTAYLNPYLGDRFNLPDKDLTTSMKFKVRSGRHVEISGKLRLPEMKVKSASIKKFLDHSSEVRYLLKGILENERVDFSSISLKCGDVQFKGKGGLRLSRQDGDYDFTLSSAKMPLSKLKHLLNPFTPDSGHVQLYARLTGDAKHFEPSLEAVFHDGALHHDGMKLSITKLDGRIALKKNSVEMNEIWVFVNNLPLRLNSRFFTENDPRFQFKLSTYPGQLPSLRQKNPLSMTVEGIGIWINKGWNGYIRLRQDSFEGEKSHETIWTASFHGLSPLEVPQKNGWDSFLHGARWKCQALNLRQRITGAIQPSAQFTLSQVMGLLLADSERLQVYLANSTFCGGKLTAKGSVDFQRLAWEMSSSVRNAEVTRVLRYFKKDYPVTGRLAFKASWKGIKGISLLNLHFKLSDGVIGPSPALTHWAEQTGIEALKSIRFRSFSGDAFRKKESWEIKELKLDSDQARMTADLKFKSKRVFGFLSVKFPASSIRDSSELKWLLRFVHADDWVDFDFKIAGNSRAPRVEWLGGEFKKKVGSALAPWMKTEFDKIIEKKMGEGPRRI